MVDARATLDTISLALDAPDADFAEPDSAFESIGGWEVEVGEDARTEQSETSDPVRSPDRQKIISMLSSIILPDDETDEQTCGRAKQPESVTQSRRSISRFHGKVPAYWHCAGEQICHLYDTRANGYPIFSGK